MSLDPITAAFDLGKTLIERFIQNPNEKADKLFRLEEMMRKGDLEEMNAEVKLLVSQADTNKIEAAHPSRFVAGWRPAVGWVCAASMACAYIPKVLMITVIWTAQCLALLFGADDIATVTIPEFPNLGMSEVLGLLGGMLGIGAMRSYDKKSGTETKGIK